MSLNTQLASDVLNYVSNPILDVDSYKTSQFLQYPPGTEHVSSYAEPRGGKFSHVVVFGIQYFCKKYLRNVPSMMDIHAAARIAKHHGVPFNYEGWSELNELGYFPLEIQAIPEGTVIPVKNAVMQIINTHPRFKWLTSYLETQILRTIWYCSTVATLSASLQSMITDYSCVTGADPMNLNFKLHNFGDRGASSSESAMLAGMSHLTSFMGTDSLAALSAVEHYYNCNIEDYLIGVSIPASEHSTITSWGQENEIDAFRNMIVKNGGYNGDGTPKMFACVSDSYNIWKALEMWKSLEGLLLETGGVLVIRPDSGCPVQTPLNVIERCMELFGYTWVRGVNGVKYKLLPDHIRVIQGDGINYDTVGEICWNMVNRRFCLDNLAFGMGGELVQKINRDTMKWAMKCSYISGTTEIKTADGVEIKRWERDVSKNPIGTSHWADEPGEINFKQSKSGRLVVVYDEDGELHTKNITDLKSHERNWMVRCYKDGMLHNQSTFEDVRKRVRAYSHLIRTNMGYSVSDFKLERGDANTINPSQLGMNASGWVVYGPVWEDYYTWVNQFTAYHPEYGMVCGDFEDKVFARDSKSYKHFCSNVEVERWDYGDI